MIYPWQEKQWQQVKHQRQQNHLPHALLLRGAAGTGKAEFAQALASSLLCQQLTAEAQACGVCRSCRLIAAGTHPDLIVLRPEPPKDSTSKKPMLMIRIEPIRALLSRMAMTSQFEDGYRVVVLENAERMTMEAANALLKTLEEPGRNSMLILTSSHPSRLPVTVVSRCQSLQFPQPSRAQALAWLCSMPGGAAAGESQAQTELRLDLVHGAPLLAQNAEQDQARQQFTTAMLAGMQQSALKHAAKLAALPHRQCLDWMLDWVADIARLQQLRTEQARLVNHDQRAALIRYAEQASAKRVYELYDQIAIYIRAEPIALNAELLWESLLLSWQGLKQ